MKPILGSLSIAVTLLLFASASTSAVVLADVPGLRSPAVVQTNIGTTICVAGYAASIRPSRSEAGHIKAKLMRTHHYTVSGDWELDHLIPLSSGGAPRDLRNLWLQPIDQAKADDAVERQTWRDICAKRITLRAGQRRMVTLKRTSG